ncbi:MAG: hypothetical protein JWQ55_2476 [Rhodopila sp.]|nr:hypothetical protein [Rhodopila sp.]
MEPFVSKHAHAVTGTLSGFDRLVFRGTLRMLAHCGGMMSYLHAVKVLLKDFASHAEAMTKRLREASEALARKTGRPIRYLASSAINKEDIAREIARMDGIEQGLICILTAVEPCLSYEIVRDRNSKYLDLQPRHRKCLHLYHYHIHPRFGFMHARIQTWFPFAVQICLNGREWLARSMDAEGLHYVQRDNCFTWLADPGQAQHLMAQQVRSDWPELLNDIAHGLNPEHAAMFAAFPMDYYWSTYQSEWATDVLFRAPQSLAGLYPKLVRHAMTTFASPDVLRFLGRKVPANGNIPPLLQAEVASDMKQRPEGVRVKHRVGTNSVKMYDKQGSVLRVETTINDVDGFKTFRSPEGKPDAPKSQQRMRKGIADLYRRSETSQACNDRFLRALAAVDDTTALGELTVRLSQPVKRDGRRGRAINPFAPGDARLIEIVSRGEFVINGFRNKDLRGLLFAEADASKQEQRRHAAAVSRQIALLRAHRLVRKVRGTHRYHLSAKGRVILTALICARNVGTEALIKLAA